MINLDLIPTYLLGGLLALFAIWLIYTDIKERK